MGIPSTVLLEWKLTINLSPSPKRGNLLHGKLNLQVYKIAGRSLWVHMKQDGRKGCKH